MPHITQIQSSAKVPLQIPKLCRHKVKPLQVQQTACLLSARGETKHRLHIWWHFKLQNPHQQPTQPLWRQRYAITVVTKNLSPVSLLTSGPLHRTLLVSSTGDSLRSQLLPATGTAVVIRLTSIAIAH